MAIGTFSDLKSTIKRWTRKDNSADFEAEIPTLIEMAENDIFRSLRVWEMESLQTLSATAGTPTIDLPSRTIEVKNVRIAQNVTDRKDYALQYMPLHVLLDQYQAEDGGTPRFYSYQEDTLYLGPSPSENTDIEALCIIKPQGLSDSATSNNILTNYGDIYLYASLVHAFAYTRNSEQIATMASLRDKAIAEANLTARKRKSSGTPAGIRSIGLRKVP